MGSRGIPPLCKDDSRQVMAANAIAFHTLCLFLQDTRDLITAHVKTDIAKQMKSDQRLIKTHGNARKAALDSWLASTHPLSWTGSGSQTGGAYAQLLYILNSDPYSPLSRLQTHPDSYSYRDIAILMYQHAVKPHFSAPICRNGAFPPALPRAVSYIQRTLPCSDNQKQAVVAVFAKMLMLMKIHFVPWYKHDGPKSRALKTRADWWMVIKATPMAEITKHLPKEPEQVNEDIAEHVMSTDPNAPWSLPDKLQDMGALWNKHLLPSDWSLEVASIPPSSPGQENHYIRETYEYVQAHYNGRIWWHHLAFVWGYLFSKVTPYVFPPRGQVVLQGGDLDAQIHALPWLERSSKNHGGCSDPLPFVTMMSTAIFSLLDTQSPLNIRASKKKNALGKPWSAKHGRKQCLNRLCRTKHGNSFLGNKEIHAINFIRIRVAKCLSSTVMQVSKYKSNWEMKSLAELKPLYDKVMGFLRHQHTEHGEYLAMKELFGNEVALRVAMKGDMKVPGFVTTQQKRDVGQIIL